MSSGGFSLPSSRLKSYCNGCGSWRSVGMIQYLTQFMISSLDGDLNSTSSPQNTSLFVWLLLSYPQSSYYQTHIGIWSPKPLMSSGGFSLPSSRLKSYCNGCGSWRSVGMIQYLTQFMISGLDGDLNSTSSPQNTSLNEGSLHCLHGTSWLLWCIRASICSCNLSTYDGPGWKDTSFISNL